MNRLLIKFLEALTAQLSARMMFHYMKVCCGDIPSPREIDFIVLHLEGQSVQKQDYSFLYRFSNFFVPSHFFYITDSDVLLSSFRMLLQILLSIILMDLVWCDAFPPPLPPWIIPELKLDSGDF